MSKMDQIGADASNLYSSAGALDPNARTAVIAWQGYDAPEWLTVPFQTKAEAGACLLTGDVAALRATSVTDSGARLTVVAHSYGSTTAGLALQDKGLAPSSTRSSSSAHPAWGVAGPSPMRTSTCVRTRCMSAAPAATSSRPSSTRWGPTRPRSFGGTRFHAEHPDRAWRSADDYPGTTAPTLAPSRWAISRRSSSGTAARFRERSGRCPEACRPSARSGAREHADPQRPGDQPTRPDRVTRRGTVRRS